MSGSISSSVSAATSSSIVSNTASRSAGGRSSTMSAMSAGCSLRQPFVGDLQLDAPRRIGLEQVDELPRDDPRRNLLEQRAQRERRARRPSTAGGWRRGRRRRPTTTFSSRWLLTGVDSSSTSLTRTTLRPWTSMICWSRRSRLSSSTPSEARIRLPVDRVGRGTMGEDLVAESAHRDRRRCADRPGGRRRAPRAPSPCAPCRTG